MPIYEYECEKCACRFELKRSFSQDEGSPCCPMCRGKVRRIFSPSLILFKGSGFYVTDSRSDRNRPSDDGETDKVEGSKKENGKADKVEGSKKEDGRADKAEDSKKKDGKTDKVQRDKKSESK